MSVEAITLVLHHSKSSGTNKVVLLGIANHYGDGGAWPAVATLARYANVSERSVQRALSELVESGELRIDLQDGGQRRTAYSPNRYWLNLACPDDCDRTTNHRVPRGDAYVTPRVTPTSSLGVTPTSPESSLETSIEPNLVQNEFEPEIEVLYEDEEFKKFWDIYPRRQGKGKARKAFREAFEAHGQVVLEGAARYASDPNLPLEKQYIPLPATWLNQERWDDEPLPERELTPEQKQAKARAEYERNREATLRANEERMAEYRRVAEEAAKNPPQLCEHDRVAVMCRVCGPKFQRPNQNK